MEVSEVSKPNNLSRRGFLHKTALAGAAVPYFVSASALGQAGKAGANERIQIGLIGAGGMGRGHLQRPPQTLQRLP
jgi:hypothetical protein